MNRIKFTLPGIGLMVDEGKMSLDDPLGIEWLPQLRGDRPDPRDEITLRHVLNMSSGLYPVANGDWSLTIAQIFQKTPILPLEIEDSM